MATMKTSGIVIRKINVGEADRILTILTHDRGKLRVIAKGVRRPKAKLAGFTDMFHYNDFVLVEGRNLDIVTSATTIERFLRDDITLEQVGTMYYLCELVDKLMEETAEVPGIFELLREVMHFVKHHPEGRPGIVKSYFEMKILILLGFSPELHRCVGSGKELAEGAKFSFSMRLGGVLQDGERVKDDFARDLSSTALKYMRLLQRYPLEGIAKIKLDEQVLREASAITSSFVEYAAEVRLKSPQVLGEL